MKNWQKDYENLKLLTNENTKYLAKQIDIIDRPNGEIGLCCLTSLFNVYPKLFKYDIKNISKELSELKGISYKTVDDIIEYFNNKYNVIHGNILHKIKLQNNEYKHNTIIESINNELPVVFYVNFKNKNIGNGHAISIFGYDSNKYYAFENANDNTILNDIAMSKALEMCNGKRKPENTIQKNIILDFAKNIDNIDYRIKKVIELQNQIITDDTIFENHLQFFKFDYEYLYNWYNIENIGLIVLNDSIKGLQDEEIEYSIKDILGESTVSNYLQFSVNTVSQILNRKLERLENEFKIDKDRLLEIIYS